MIADSSGLASRSSAACASANRTSGAVGGELVLEHVPGVGPGPDHGDADDVGEGDDPDQGHRPAPIEPPVLEPEAQLVGRQPDEGDIRQRQQVDAGAVPQRIEQHCRARERHDCQHRARAMGADQPRGRRLGDHVGRQEPQGRADPGCDARHQVRGRSQQRGRPQHGDEERQHCQRGPGQPSEPDPHERAGAVGEGCPRHPLRQ